MENATAFVMNNLVAFGFGVLILVGLITKALYKPKSNVYIDSDMTAIRQNVGRVASAADVKPNHQHHEQLASIAQKANEILANAENLFEQKLTLAGKGTMIGNLSKNVKALLTEANELCENVPQKV